VSWLRAQPDQAELVRACFYDDPLLAAAERYRASPEWQAMRRLVPAEPGRALDLGAGRGIVAHALAREGWEVVAVEPDPSAVVGAGAVRQLAGDAGVEIDVVQEWGERLPFRDGSFDLVVARAVLHHARDLPALCREVARVLASDGRFVAAREHVVSSPEDVPRFQASHPLHRLYGGENAYRRREYERALRGAGLRLDRVLNPYASDVNLFPETRDAVRARLARRLRVPRWAFPAAALPLLGALDRTPGRLYTFVGSRVG